MHCGPLSTAVFEKRCLHMVSSQKGTKQHQRIPCGPGMHKGTATHFWCLLRGSETAKQPWCLGQGRYNLWGLSDQRWHSKCYQGRCHNKDMNHGKLWNLEANPGFGKTLSWLKTPWNNERNPKWIMIKLLSGKIGNLKQKSSLLTRNIKLYFLNIQVYRLRIVSTSHDYLKCNFFTVQRQVTISVNLKIRSE